MFFLSSMKASFLLALLLSVFTSAFLCLFLRLFDFLTDGRFRLLISKPHLNIIEFKLVGFSRFCCHNKTVTLIPDNDILHLQNQKIGVFTECMAFFVEKLLTTLYSEISGKKHLKHCSELKYCLYFY